ncbi:hypothetical protein [Streptomyces cucumeris]|uniref:hypothetical protein n=1 Tax=Streptomyces cucumeris TaxID=2962890 RepID=UPI003D7117CB
MGTPILMPEPGTSSADCSACPAGKAHTTGGDSMPAIGPFGQKSHAAPAFSMFIGSATTASSRGAGTPVKIGALLPVGSVADLDPVRDREPILVGLTVVVIAGGAVAVSLLDLPDVASGAVVVALAILVLLLLFGRRWHRYLPIADMVKPGP